MQNTANRAKRKPAPFGVLLLRLRAAAGLTQEQLAARAGLSPNAIAALESGKRRTPRPTTVELLAAALGLEAQERAQFAAAARESGEAPKAHPAAAGTGDGAARDPRLQSWRSVSELTPLVDRMHELDTTQRLLSDGGARLLTLTGPAGVGKTRLAVEAASRLAADTVRFPDGALFVDLTPIRDPAQVPGAIANALGLLDTGSRPVLERLVEVLEERQQFLVLDNFEQVLAAAVSLTELLAGCPNLSLLVTSRVPLQLRWERVLRVPPLPVPNLAAPLPPLEALGAIPSVALFVQRAQARQPDFLLTEIVAPVVARVVSQLDGLPLALELAAVRTATLPLPLIANRLDDRLRLLEWEAGDLPERQQSLEAAVGWSYDLLSEAERRLFRCLGVFVGQVGLDAITAVIRTVGDEVAHEAPAARETAAGSRTLPRLLSLAEKSLLLPLPVRPDAEEDGADDVDEEPTFGMLETAREYAWERLAAEGELATAQRAHAHYFLALAERAAPALHGRDQRAWFFRLEREHDNLRAALRWLLDQARSDDSDFAAEWEAGLRLAGALGYFWYLRGYHTEGRRWLEESLASAPQGKAAAGMNSAARTQALIAAGPLLMVHAEYSRALEVLEEGLALAENQQDPAAIAGANTYLGHAAVVAGDVEGGTRRLQEAVRRWESLGDPAGLGEARFYRGYAADVMGDTATAVEHYTAALSSLGDAGNTQHAGFVHSYLGVLESRRGNQSSAVTHIQAVLQTSVALRDRWLLSFAAQATVALVGSHAQPAAWARLLGAADALGKATGGATFGWEHLPGAQNVVELRKQLTQDKERSAAYREGRTLPMATVASLAICLLDEGAQAPAGSETDGWPDQAAEQSISRSAAHSLLTSREREVLRLVSQGYSNKAIGHQLFISDRTVAQHLTTIFNKLGATTRAQAVAVATQRGLL
jgi:predicted ATPase/DNA-binding CsgD family transcriptional regulator/transcriptional regulator with XRE-family HTH domain